MSPGFLLVMGVSDTVSPCFRNALGEPGIQKMKDFSGFRSITVNASAPSRVRLATVLLALGGIGGAFSLF